MPDFFFYLGKDTIIMYLTINVILDFIKHLYFEARFHEENERKIEIRDDSEVFYLRNW